MSIELEELYEQIQGYVIEGLISEDDLIKLGDTIGKYAKSLKADPNKEYFSKHDGEFCYKGVLEGKSYKVMLNDLQELLEKSEQWLEDIRNNRYAHSKDTVNTFEDHPKQVEMSKYKTIDKTALRKSRSLVELIKRLEMYVTTHDNLMNLNKDVEALKASDVEKSARIKRLEEAAGLSELSDRELCKRLYEAGFKQVDLADRFNKDARTIRRWCKD